LGITLTLGKAADGSVCLNWRGPKGLMTNGLLADLAANKNHLVEFLRAERRAGVTAAFTATYDRIGSVYPEAEDAGLPEVARQLPDLFACVDTLEAEVTAAAIAYAGGICTWRQFESALQDWEHGVLDAIATLESVRNGRNCTDCGREAWVTVITSLGQRLCSRCWNADGGASPERRFPP
jgi:hypothetical protein